MKIKLLTKFTVFLVLLAVIPAAVVGVRTIAINREGMQAAILELHLNMATHLADKVYDHLENLEKEMQYLLHTVASRTSWEERQSVLQALLDTNGNFVDVSMAERGGREVLKAYNPVLEDNPALLFRGGEPAFKEFWKNPSQPRISPIYFVDEDPRITIIYPLNASYCLYATIALDNLWDSIRRTRIAATGYAFLVDSTGIIIAHPDAAREISHESAANLPSVRQVLKAETAGSSEYVHPKSGKTIVGAYAPVKSLKWGVIIQQDKDEAFLSVTRMKRQAALLILISLAAASLIALFLARGLTRPIMKLTDAARRVAGKDFTARVDVDTRDELQQLAETFNQMTRELQAYERIQVDKLLEEKTKTESVIFSITDGIVMTDSRGALQLANTEARTIMNLTAEGWQGKPLADFVAHTPLAPAFTEILSHPKDHLVREVNLSTPDRANYFLLTAAEVTIPGTGEAIGIVTVIRNITLEKELSRMKENFLHSITHDLRNPMTSIRGFLKFLIDGVAGPTTPQQQKMLATIDRASHRLLSLINDILDIAKLESGKLTPNLSEVNLAFAAQHSIEIAEGLALKNNVKISLDAPADLPLLNLDPDLLERVFANLLNNALKFTPKDGKIDIIISRPDDRQVQIVVADTGEGIPSDYLDKIFDKFQQVTGQRKGGTGLGLTICKHIVEAHRGTIHAESKLGEGARFVIVLPSDLTPEKLQIDGEAAG